MQHLKKIFSTHSAFKSNNMTARMDKEDTWTFQKIKWIPLHSIGSREPEQPY